MELIVSGLSEAPVPFLHLWGRYVTGFRPWKHCLACFESKTEAAVRPAMRDGVYALRDDLEFFYLCGVGQRHTKKAGPLFAQKRTNVHLAVRPRAGSVAAVGSVYGASFVIRDAEAIPIVALRQEDFPHLAEAHVRCKNFQFGYQIFETALTGDAAPQEIVRRLREAGRQA